MRERLERVESPGTYSMKLNEFHSDIFAGPVFFQTALPCSGFYHLGRGVMRLHDAVGINCEKGVTTENQGADVEYMGFGVYVVNDFVCVI